MVFYVLPVRSNLGSTRSPYVVRRRGRHSGLAVLYNVSGGQRPGKPCQGIYRKRQLAICSHLCVATAWKAMLLRPYGWSPSCLLTLVRSKMGTGRASAQRVITSTSRCGNVPISAFKAALLRTSSTRGCAKITLERGRTDGSLSERPKK